MAGPTLSLTGRALRLLSAREHSRAELERKLARFEEEPGALARVLVLIVSALALAVLWLANHWIAGRETRPAN